MSRTLEYLSIASLSILLIGTLLAPNAPEMWLASNSLVFMVVRVVLILIIGALLLSRPLFTLNEGTHQLVGLLAVGISAWALVWLYYNYLPLLDGMAFGLAGIALGVEAFEHEYQALPDQLSPMRQIYSDAKYLAAQYALLTGVVVNAGRRYLAHHSANLPHRLRTSSQAEAKDMPLAHSRTASPQHL